MSTPRTLTAVSFDQDRLCLVHGVVSAGRVQIQKAAVAAAPQGLDGKDPAAAGGWLAAEMDKAGMGKGRLVFAVPRSEVVLKTMKLPRLAGASEEALAGIVRLQMTRQLTMAVEGTAIDYAMIGEEEGEKPTVGVLAAALPGERLGWYREVAKAAGCKIERVGLRAAGAAALLAGVSERHTGPVLGLAAGWGSVEFVVVAEGRLVFARSADVGLAAGPDFVTRVAVEAKRTWMSFRGAEGASEVDAVVMPERGSLAQDLGAACAGAMELPLERAELPTAIEVPEMSEEDRLVLAPLIGLMAEDIIARPTIDFASPRKAPDLAAAKRVRVLAAVLGVILIGGGGIGYAMWDLNGAKADLAAAQSAGESLRAKQGAYLAQAARLSHIQKWTGARVDWLSHLKFLSDQMPDPRQALMDQVTGNLAARVEFATKDRYDPAAWQASQRAAFSIQGHVKQRDIADSLRERLVAAKDIYSDVESKGPDTPEQFALSLVSGLPSAEKPPVKPKESKGGEAPR